MKRGWAIAILASVLLVVALLVPTYIYLRPCSTAGTQVFVCVRPSDTSSSVADQLREAGVRTTGFALLSKVLGYNVRTGRYEVMPSDNILTLFRRLRSGQQTPVNLTLRSVRTMHHLAGFLGKHLMMDSTQVATAFTDSVFCASQGYTVATLPALFVPNTYQLYWNISIPDFVQRMKRENAAFWTTERDQLARQMGLSHEEVMTLASIVDEETANNGEKPMIAGMYVNRLRKNMLLQADPTVKFALGDFALRRIRGEHLRVESPYNTYRNKGLPPGPIRIPSVAGIDAVLHYAHHDYLYMCAKEDFSGTHNFARTYPEHQRNARRYVQALNERNIFK